MVYFLSLILYIILMTNTTNDIVAISMIMAGIILDINRLLNL